MSNKQIAKLITGKHLAIDLVDQPMSLFLDGDSGVIFLEEGHGPDRVNGAVLLPDRLPGFVVEWSNNKGILRLYYCGKWLVVGETSIEFIPKEEVETWVRQANANLFENRNKQEQKDNEAKKSRSVTPVEVPTISYTISFSESVVFDVGSFYLSVSATDWGGHALSSPAGSFEVYRLEDEHWLEDELAIQVWENEGGATSSGSQFR